MPLSPAFQIQQSALLPGTLIFADVSAGSDNTITTRRIYIQQSNGTYVVPAGTTTDYIVWDYSDTTITLNVLTEDIAANVRVDWLTGSTVVVYTSANTFCFAEFNKQFLYYLVQQQALTPEIVQDSNYFSNMSTFWMNVTGGIQAIVIGSDVSASQNALNRATEMRLNESKYF